MPTITFCWCAYFMFYVLRHHSLFVLLQVILLHFQCVKVCVCVYPRCVCVRERGRERQSERTPDPECWKCLSLHDSLVVCAAVLSQKGGELGLSILGCELRQRLDKAASGCQPISGLPPVLRSYGRVIGPGVAGWEMDKWRKETRSSKTQDEDVAFCRVRVRTLVLSSPTQTAGLLLCAHMNMLALQLFHSIWQNHKHWSV